MSNLYSSISIYVRELDRYITIGSDPYEDNRWMEEQDNETEMRERLKLLDPIELFSGQSLTFTRLWDSGISPEHWQWGHYEADRYLRHYISWRKLEPLLVRQLHSLGRAYAIRRYARRERVPTVAAMAAALPHGVKAVLYEYFASEGLQEVRDLGQRINLILDKCSVDPALTAYSRTASVQAEIHAIATEVWGPSGPLMLGRKTTRDILSLTRLHFSVAETKCNELAAFTRLCQQYDDERKRLSKTGPGFIHPFARFIPNWHLQHVRPLTAFYPISIRDTFCRGNKHLELKGSSAPRNVIVNELALAYCSTSLIDERARLRDQAKQAEDSPNYGFGLPLS